MQKTKIATSDLIETGKDATKLLNLADKALHQMPFLIAPLVSRFYGIVPERDNWLNAVGDQFIPKFLCLVAAASNQVIKFQVNRQIVGFDDVMALSSGQVQARGICPSHPP